MTSLQISYILSYVYGSPFLFTFNLECINSIPSAAVIFRIALKTGCSFAVHIRGRKCMFLIDYEIDLFPHDFNSRPKPTRKKKSQFSVFMNVVVVKRLDKTKDSLHPNIKSDYRLIHSSKQHYAIVFPSTKTTCQSTRVEDDYIVLFLRNFHHVSLLFLLHNCKFILQSQSAMRAEYLFQPTILQTERFHTRIENNVRF